MLEIYDLRTEYRTNPMGIDATEPRFSWKIRSDRKGVTQTSYQIMVCKADCDTPAEEQLKEIDFVSKREKKDVALEVVWNSGFTASRESQRIRYQGENLESRQKYYWNVEITVTDENGQMESAESELAFFEMGLLQESDWSASWLEPEEEVDYDARKPVIYLRKIFQVKPGFKKARIYQTAHGLYDFWMNGMAGTQDKFLPGLTSYYYRIQYQVYDVTDLLKLGENAWGIRLADGWWRGITGGTVKNNFGYKLHFLGQLELEYEDGRREVIGTDESFRWSTGGMLASDMQMGDIYDAGMEPEGWNLAGFDDKNWKTVHILADDIHEDIGNKNENNQKEEKQNYMDAQKIATRSVPVRGKETFLPKEFTDTNGNRILDFGQNIAGYVHMKLRNCKKGQIIRLTHGEDIKNGAFSMDNLASPTLPLDAYQEVTYICKGEKEEQYCPAFSIFGFRYVKLEGYTEEIQPGDFLAVAVYSDMPETGDFTCSNPLINQLVKNSRWSQKGNYMDVPVDCPTRERNAWTGDAQIYARTATDFMDVYTFYEKWMQDQAIEQYESGKVGITFPSTSSVHNKEELAKTQAINPSAALAGPEGNGNIGEDSAGWGDAAVWIPKMMYLCYGDKQILENQYDTAKRWVKYMLECAAEHNPLYIDRPQYHHVGEDGTLDGEWIFDTRMHYGEWCEPIPFKFTGGSLEDILANMAKEGKPLVATAYMARSAENVAEMAGILGKSKDAKQYQNIADRIRWVYNRYLIAEDGTIEPGHQAAYVRALALKMCSEEKHDKVVAQLIKEIEDNDYCLNTGFLSTPFLLPVLVDEGYTDEAFRILEQTKNPSWLHAVTLGATTILENWDGMDQHKSSFNHYSYGAVCEFLFAYVAGIRPLWEHPGYEEFLLKPVVGGTLTHAEASYESIYGRIYSGWKLEENQLIYTCEIPVNTKAMIELPDGSKREHGSGRYEWTLSMKGLNRR